jgi:hypothetical protein
MESFFGANFADVRIHVGHEASSIGALAFTIGSDLYFAPGQYNPQTMQGQQLLGHELTHVVQQRAGRVRNPLVSGTAVVQDPALEAEAERMGMRAATSPTPIQAKSAAVGRGVTYSGATRPAALGPHGSILPSHPPAHSAAQRKLAPIVPAYPAIPPRGNGPDTSSAPREIASVQSCVFEGGLQRLAPRAVSIGGAVQARESATCAAAVGSVAPRRPVPLAAEILRRGSAGPSSGARLAGGPSRRSSALQGKLRIRTNNYMGAYAGLYHSSNMVPLLDGIGQVISQYFPGSMVNGRRGPLAYIHEKGEYVIETIADLVRYMIGDSDEGPVMEFAKQYGAAHGDYHFTGKVSKKKAQWTIEKAEALQLMEDEIDKYIGHLYIHSPKEGWKSWYIGGQASHTIGESVAGSESRFTIQLQVSRELNLISYHGYPDQRLKKTGVGATKSSITDAVDE